MTRKGIGSGALVSSVLALRVLESKCQWNVLSNGRLKDVVPFGESLPARSSKNMYMYDRTIVRVSRLLELF